MNTITLDDETRRFIGDSLARPYRTPLPISGISEATGISRVTLTKWVKDDFQFWRLTAHISDAELSPFAWRTPDSRESRYRFHAVENCRRIMDIRRRAASGELGEDFRRAEADRAYSQHHTRA